MNPVWPASSPEIVLWAQTVSVWIVAVYAVTFDWTQQSRTTSFSRVETVRVVIAATFVALSVFALPPPGSSLAIRLELAAVLVTPAVMIVLTKRRLALRESALRQWFPEIEIMATVAATLLSGALIGMSQVGSTPRDPIVRSGKAAAIFSVVAAAILAYRGGTSIVRAVLDKAGAKPRAKNLGSTQPTGDSSVDVKEFNRGRSIGNLERLLMIMVIGLGSYEALGFLIAAKGLIRAREFEDRDFAEYFILGSLTSAAVAMALGMALRFIVPILWKS